MYIMLNTGLLPKKSGNHHDQSANFMFENWEGLMKTSVKRWLAALTVGPLLYSGVAIAGGQVPAAGTLLGEEKLGTSQTVGLIVLAVVAVALVVYLRRRK